MSAQSQRSGSRGGSSPVGTVSRRHSRVGGVASDYLVRNANAGGLLETYLVSAVAAVVGVRFFLELTGYPQIGGGGLHIAHMLWGGLLMLAALVMLLGFLSAPLTRLAAIAGGIGFGLFIDELGKFITSDNNYFFQPTIALIYGVFVLLFLAFRALNLSRPLTRQEYLVNAVELVKDLVREDLDVEEKRRAEAYLSRGDPGDPLVVALRDLLDQITPIPAGTPNIVGRSKQALRNFYRSIIARRWFRLFVIAFFAVTSILPLVLVLALLLLVPEFAGMVSSVGLSTPDLVVVLSSAVVALLCLAGVVLLWRSRLRAYRLLRVALLVSIFVVQFFSFFNDQLAALVGLAFNLVALAVVNYAISQEAVGDTA